ncbi:hypothetical protein Tco_1054616 [Tanacetum coccineum]|uniref:Uncharacterized protein n=1 Tax=Tanacetum coccineum TaxID=301880 RepID=A0ABQ5GXQ5_9ASTR
MIPSIYPLLILTSYILSSQRRNKNPEETKEGSAGKLLMMRQGMRKVLDLEKAKYDQAIEIAKLKKRHQHSSKSRKSLSSKGVSVGDELETIGSKYGEGLLIYGILILWNSMNDKKYRVGGVEFSRSHGEGLDVGGPLKCSYASIMALVGFDKK